MSHGTYDLWNAPMLLEVPDNAPEKNVHDFSCREDKIGSYFIAKRQFNGK